MNKIILLIISVILFNSNLGANEDDFKKLDEIHNHTKMIELKLKTIQSKYSELEKQKKKLDEEMVDMILDISNQSGNFIRKNELIKSLNSK